MNARLTLFTNFLLLNVVFVTQIFLISNMKGFFAFTSMFDQGK